MYLTLPQKILSLVVVVVVALLWWPLLQRIVHLGDRLDYSGLKALGEDGLIFIQHYGAYVWWFIGLVCTLLLLYMLYQFILFTYRVWQAREVNASTLNNLVNKLSAQACEVIHWTWTERRNPITVGDLQRALHELSQQRFEKIRIVEQQAALLDARRKQSDSTTKDLQSVEFRV